MKTLVLDEQIVCYRPYLTLPKNTDTSHVNELQISNIKSLNALSEYACHSRRLTHLNSK